MSLGLYHGTTTSISSWLFTLAMSTANAGAPYFSILRFCIVAVWLRTLSTALSVASLDMEVKPYPLVTGMVKLVLYTVKSAGTLEQELQLFAAAAAICAASAGDCAGTSTHTPTTGSFSDSI